MVLGLLLVLLVGCGSSSSMRTPVSPLAISLQVVATGFNGPLDIEQPNDNSGRLFVVEQGGTIKIIQNGAVLSQPFLNISSKVMVQDEMGRSEEHTSELQSRLHLVCRLLR